MPLVLMTNANPGTSYWGVLPPSGLTDWEEDGLGNLHPVTDGQQDLGIPTYRVDSFNGVSMALSNELGPIRPVALNGSIAAQFSSAGLGTGIVSANRASILAVYNRSDDASTADYGSLVHGFVESSGGTASIIAENGAFAGGRIEVQTEPGNISALDGGFAHGRVFYSGYIQAQYGGFAHGMASYGGSIAATGNGSVAMGYAGGQGAITAEADGSVAMGWANDVGSEIVASAVGALAIGYTYNGDAIIASGEGSVAMGVTNDGAVLASALGAVQVNSGTNNVAISLKVGNDTYGIRLIGTGTPSVRAGDFWCDGTDVFVRTGGGNKNMSDIP